MLAELVEPAVDLLQRLGIDGIKPPGSFGPYGGKAGFSKHPQMLGNRRLADAKFRRYGLHHCAGWMLTCSQQLQDPAPDGVTQNIHCVHGQQFYHHLLI